MGSPPVSRSVAGVRVAFVFSSFFFSKSLGMSPKGQNPNCFLPMKWAEPQSEYGVTADHASIMHLIQLDSSSPFPISSAVDWLWHGSRIPFPSQYISYEKEAHLFLYGENSTINS